MWECGVIRFFFLYVVVGNGINYFGKRFGGFL